MLIVFYSLLMLRVGRCTDTPISQTKAVRVGDNVKLTCTRRDMGSIFWIRVVSENFPEVLGKTFGFGRDDHRIRTKTEPETFVLYISAAKLSDTAFYYCLKILQQNLTFLTGTYLRVEGPEPNNTAVPPSNPVHPGDSGTLQCLVLLDSDKKACPGDHSVYWFRAASDESHPSLITSSDECEKRPEAHDLQKCVYNLSKTISSSDAGTYYCAVATCGEILFGNGTNLDREVSNWDSERAKTVLFLLCVALVISLIVIASLICSTKACDCCSGPGNTGGQQNQHLINLKRDADTSIYSTVIFTMTKAHGIGPRGTMKSYRYYLKSECIQRINYCTYV